MTTAERLAHLAAVDPVSAGLMKPLLDSIRCGSPGVSSFGRSLTLSWVQQNALDGSPDVVIVPGSGMGLDLRSLMDEIPGSCRVFWMEADPRRAAEVFLQAPLETYVENGRLLMVLGRDEKRAEQRFLGMWNLPQAARFKIFDRTSAGPEDEHFYNSVLRSICRSVLLDIFNMGTLICRGGLWQVNTLINLPLLLRNPGIDALANAFPGKPALVVGAGPSLDKALPYLKACSKGFVVISTGTALRALHEAGIRPDLAVAVDAHPLTASQFQTPCDDLYLVCSTLVFPPATRKFKGFFAGTLSANPIDGWLDKLTGERGRMLAAGTVTSTAVDLAVRMGCNPVATIGFDLSLADDGTTHAANTMYHGVRLNTDYPELSRVPGNYQDSVLTTQQFRNYITLLEKYIKQHTETSFVNINCAGARIQGMTLAPPAGLAGFAASNFDATATVESLHRMFDDDFRRPVAEALDAHLGKLDTVAGSARHAARICNELLMLSSSSGHEALAAMKRLTSDLEAEDRALQDMQTSSFLLEMSLWPACYWFASRKSEHEKTYSETVFTYKRWRQFYEQIAGAAMWTRDIVKQTIAGLGPRTGLPDDGPESVRRQRFLKQRDTETADAVRAQDAPAMATTDTGG